MTISTPASPTKSDFYLCLALLFLTGCAKAELLELLISTEQITATTDALFYDDQIAVDIDGDGSSTPVSFIIPTQNSAPPPPAMASMHAPTGHRSMQHITGT